MWKLLPLLFVLVGCGILAPDARPTVDVWYVANDLGVVFRAESQPPDTVFWTLDYYVRDTWENVMGMDTDGSVGHALVWITDVALVAKFKAWSPDSKPDSVWYGHHPET